MIFQRWRDWWSQEHATVNRIAFWMATASVLSRVLGVLRDRLLASQYGAGWQLDAYYAAFRLPDTLYNLLIVGALSAGFIPLFSRLHAEKGKESAVEFSSLVVGWVAAAMGLLALVGIVFAPQIIPLLVNGFDPQRMELTVTLTRILFLSPLLLGVSAVFGGVLQASKRILAFAFAPIWYNLGILFGILVLTRWCGISGVAIGVVLGAFFHAFTQWLVASNLGVSLPKKLSWTKDLRQLVILTAPRLAAIGASQLSLVILLSFASTLRKGSVAVLELGDNLQSFPLGVIGVSFAIAAFPLLSEAAGTKRFDQYHSALEKTGRTIVFFLLPVSLVFILLRAQIVRLILGDGRFDWTATVQTADVVGWLSISLVAQALIPLLARAFYAIQSTWTPFWITIAGEALNIIVAVTLKKPLGVAGLAIAFSTTTFFQLIMLWLTLRKRVGGNSQSKFLQMLLQSLLACIPAMIIAYLVRNLIGSILPLRSVWQVAIQLGLSSASAGAVYLLVMWLVNVEEAQLFLHQGTKLLKRLW